MLRKLLALAIVLLLPVPALAGTNTLSLICEYPNYRDQEGVHRTKYDFTLTFIIDLDKGVAYTRDKTGITRSKYTDEEIWTCLRVSQRNA